MNKYSASILFSVLIVGSITMAQTIQPGTIVQNPAQSVQAPKETTSILANDGQNGNQAALNNVQVNGPSQNQSSNAASSANGLTSIISYGASAAMTAWGVSQMHMCCAGATQTCCPTAYSALAMGAQAALQGLNSAGTSAQNAGVAAETATGGTTTATTPTPGITQAAQEASVELKTAQDLMAAKGGSLDTATGVLTTPQGTQITPADTGSDSALASATGMSPSDAKNVMAKVASIEKDAIAKAKAHYSMGENGFADGGGAADSKATTDTVVAARRIPAAASAQPQHSDMAGMTKNFHGALIGVSGDDIFQMMNRRYQEKIKNDNFLLAPVALPATAAVPQQAH